MITGRDRDEIKLHRERAGRVPVSLVCDIRQGQRPWAHSRLLNLSENGFCVVWLPAMELNRSMWLRIPGLQLLKTNIRWRSGSMMGYEFEQHLHPAVFEHIVRRANRQRGGVPAQLWSA